MVMWLPIELPLFRRELTELAQRRRTYLLRVFGAIVLLTFVVYTVAEVTQTGMFLRQQGMMLPGAGIANAGLGIGGSVFDRIVPLLFLMIPALLPALCCSAITSEKEQNTFGTLLLTRLSPSTIILEKLLSRIVPMLTLLLLVSPVLAWVYSLGGVDPGMLFGAVWLLFCECLLFAALSLFFSAWFPSTVTTFVWSYIGAGLLVVIGNIFPLTAFGAWNHEVGLDRIFVPYAPAPLTGSGALFLALALRSLIPLLLSMMLLAGARAVIVRRAFVGHSSLVINVFRHLDQFFRNLNAWTTGGIELVAESNALPDDDPVTWRERNKKSLGQFRWLVRILLLLESPTLFVCAIVAIGNPMATGSASIVLLTMLWVFAAVLAAVKGASLFSQERSRQTLEPLLSTTLTSRELVEQKVIGTNRLLIVLACPILTVYLTQAFMNWRSNSFLMMSYLVVSTLLTFVILRTIVWITSAVGIWVRSQTKAIAVSIVLVGVLAVVPMIPAKMVEFGQQLSGSNTTGLPLRLSALGAPGAIASMETMLPTTGFRSSQYRTRGPRGAEVAVIPVAQIVVFAFLVQLAYLLAARWFVLRVAPKLLQRLDEGQPPVLTLSARHAHA